MRRYIAGMWLVVMLAGVGWGQSVSLPKTVSGDPGAWIVVVPDSKDGGEVKWRLGTGLTLVPIDKLFPGQKSAGVVVTGRAGTYEVWAWNAKGDVASELAVCKVVIGADPGPGPNPGPTPNPDDPLTKVFQAAYDKETDADKVTLRKKFADHYKTAATLADSKNPQGEYDAVTWGQLFSILKDAAGRLGLAGKLPLVQAVVQDELKAKFPTDAKKPLTLDDRVLIAQTYKRLAATLEGVK